VLKREPIAPYLVIFVAVLMAITVETNPSIRRFLTFTNAAALGLCTCRALGLYVMSHPRVVEAVR